MTTRFEKYKIYREEINKDIKFNNDILETEKLIKNYQKKIKQINHNIIIQNEDETPINLINAITNSNQIINPIPNEITSNFKIINQYKLECLEKQKNVLLIQLNNFSILTPDQKNFLDTWLLKNSLYKSFLNIKNDNVKYNQKNKDEIVKKELIKNYKNYYQPIKNLSSPIVFSNFDLNHKFSLIKYLFFSIIIIFFVLFCVFVSLIIIDIFI